MKKFVRNNELGLMKGGYLVNLNLEESYVSNSEFVIAQEAAHKLCIYAREVRNMDFKGKKADTLEDLENRVEALLMDKPIVYFDKPSISVGELTLGLREEALNYMVGLNKSKHTDAINKAMQPYNIINEYETVGLFVEEKIVKLPKIYTIMEIKGFMEVLVGIVSL